MFSCKIDLPMGNPTASMRMNEKILPVLFAAFALASCASSRPITMVAVDAEPYQRDAALIERGLERHNRTDFDCEVQHDTLIVCDGVKHRLR
jgi:hypothetical protein